MDLDIQRLAETAAILRGSSITILPCSGGMTSSRARGTRVVLPAPGGACSTTAGFRSTASLSFGRMLSMGREVIMGALLHKKQKRREVPVAACQLRRSI